MQTSWGGGRARVNARTQVDADADADAEDSKGYLVFAKRREQLMDSGHGNMPGTYLYPRCFADCNRSMLLLLRYQRWVY